MSDVTRTVLFDIYTWITPIEGRPDRVQYHRANKGDEITVSAEEAERGEGLGALGSSKDLQRQLDLKAVVTSGEQTGPATDDEINAMNVERVVAYVNQYPGELDRVLDLEDARPKPRSTVLALSPPAP